MAASIARKVTAVLFALAMVGSIAVGPALADDDDVTVGGDGVSVGGDDGVTVGAGEDGSENGSTTVEAEAGEDGADTGVDVSGGDGDGTSGELDCDVDSDTQDPADACETSGGDSGGDAPSAPESGDAPSAPESGDTPEGDLSEFPNGDLPEAPGGGSSGPSAATDPISTPEVPVEAPDLPVSYTGDGIEAQGETVVPFGALPPFCNPPYGVDDVREVNPVDPTDPVPGQVKEQAPSQVPTQPPQTPVGNPIGLVGAPIGQCDVFNPYDPAVNPTSPPDDPSATTDPGYSADTDRVAVIESAEVVTGEDGPQAETMTLVLASRDYAGVMFESGATDSQSEFGLSTTAEVPDASPDRSTTSTSVTVFSRSAGLNIDCDGSECKPTATGVPSGDAVPAFPVGGDSEDGGDDPEPSPDADAGQPGVGVNEDRVIVYEDRSATLGDGLPGGSNRVIILTDGQQTEAQQRTQGSQGDNQVNVRNDYESGQYPGDDYAQVNAKANGGGVIVGLDCDDYSCTPTQGTGVYAGPAGMVFEMIPDNPAQG